MTDLLPEELRTCVIENDVKNLKKMLDDMGIRREGTEIFTDKKRRNLCIILSYASACAKNGFLKEEFSNELIERVAMLVEVYDFLNNMLLYLDHQPKEEEGEGFYAPRRLIDEMHRMFPNDSIYTLVRTMSTEQFMFLSELMVTGEFKELNRKCTAPILLYCYNKCILPHDICLAYIATSLMRVDNITTAESIMHLFSDDEDYPSGEESLDEEMPDERSFGDLLSDLYDELNDPNHKPF